MKTKRKQLLIIVAMIFVGLSTSACFIKEEPEASTKVLEAIPTDRFIIIETTQIGYDNVDVFVDTQTNIEYALVNYPPLNSLTGI